MNYKDSLHFKKFMLSANKRPEQLTTTADGQPEYVFLMTEPTNIKLFLAALTTPEFLKSVPPPVPSSTFIFEVLQGEDGLYVQALFNDEPVPLKACGPPMCNLTTFMKSLESTTSSDVVDLCNNEALIKKPFGHGAAEQIVQ
jgi:hypothetical protein